MPRNNRHTSYGAEFELLLTQAYTCGGIEIDLHTPENAKAFRMKLYAYFRAIHRAKPPRPDLAEYADSVSLAVNGSFLQVILIANLPDVRAVRIALGLKAPELRPRLRTSQEKMQDELAKIRQRKKESRAVLPPND